MLAVIRISLLDNTMLCRLYIFGKIISCLFHAHKQFVNPTNLYPLLLIVIIN